MGISGKILGLAALAGLALGLAGCGVNTIPTKDEAVKAAWAQVQTEYQRRSDLVPNLVATVAGYAAQEKSTLIAVTQARAACFDSPAVQLQHTLHKGQPNPQPPAGSRQ